MTSSELREKFLEYFEKNGHTRVPSSSLLPDDPSVLLTTAGMQQFKPYYTGEADPFKSPHPTLGGKPLGSNNTVSAQKSFRTSDIEEVGDESHLTFFEMLGNFSFGGYFKKDAIRYAKEFLDSINIEIDYVTVFQGDNDVLKDVESSKIWEKYGFSEEKENLKYENREENFWGPTGSEGPCGPTTEIYAGGVEIWNIVFNEYYCHVDGKLERLKTPGVDTGLGLERLAMVSQGKNNIFETDLFQPIFNAIIEVQGDKPVEKLRIITDHLRAAAFLIADGIRPSNTERGYILRRLIRRAMVTHYKFIGADLDPQFYIKPVQAIITLYGKEGPYEELKQSDEILDTFQQETERFSKSLERGMKELEKVSTLSGKQAFDLYQSFGLPPEITYEQQSFDWEEFNRAQEEHLKISAAGSEKKFGGHGLVLDTGELKAATQEEVKIVTRLHTATHLLQSALRKVLGEDVHQAGSDITAERTRFDFTFDRKLTDEEVKQVEDLVNKAIQDDLLVKYEELPYEEAIKTNALHFAKEKYPAMVKVYTMDSKYPEPFSQELCGGPHVEHTQEVGSFKIAKQESVAAGVRRIRGMIS